jgi:hypothetical protein
LCSVRRGIELLLPYLFVIPNAVVALVARENLKKGETTEEGRFTDFPK